MIFYRDNMVCQNQCSKKNIIYKLPRGYDIEISGFHTFRGYYAPRIFRFIERWIVVISSSDVSDFLFLTARAVWADSQHAATLWEARARILSKENLQPLVSAYMNIVAIEPSVAGWSPMAVATSVLSGLYELRWHCSTCNVAAPTWMTWTGKPSYLRGYSQWSWRTARVRRKPLGYHQLIYRS